MSELFLFYFFTALVLISATMVISVKNPVHSVLFLILAFISAAGLLFLLEIEFISLIFIVVYVGAIAVLFLFVVMMLDIKITDLNRNFLKYFPIGSFLGFAFLIEILLILINILEFNSYEIGDNSYNIWINNIDFITNIEAIGQILYTYYFSYFLIAGIILLIAMVGAIVLTLTFNRKARAQSIYKQAARDYLNAIFLINKI
jgi:NADH-quinone oxidoreductase subunit J